MQCQPEDSPKTISSDLQWLVTEVITKTNQPRDNKRWEGGESCDNTCTCSSAVTTAVTPPPTTAAATVATYSVKLQQLQHEMKSVKH